MQRGRRAVSALVVGTALLAFAGCGPAESSTATPSPRSSSGHSATSPVAGDQSVTLTFVGDNILGTDDRFDPGSSLPARWAAAGNNPTYFYQNVAPIFRADDLTVANVEVTLSRRGQKIDKGPGEVYHFRGDPSIATTLAVGGVELATLANNHTGDYGPVGYADTVAALTAAHVGVFGYERTLIRTVKGIRIGFLGLMTWSDTPEIRRQLVDEMKRLRAQGADVVIPFFHWGIEATYEPYEVQTALARVAIDNGADAVIGSHPHVVQSMAVYRGRFIAYSLGNFAFGGNNNPTDKRSVIVQLRLHTTGRHLQRVEYRVIPTRVSRTDAFNDFVPTPYGPVEARQVLDFVNGISPTLHGMVRATFGPVPPA